MRFSAICVVLMMAANPLSAADGVRPPTTSRVRSPLAPAEALKEFRLPDDLSIDLVAAEPDIIAPVSIAFDERGRLWAVEMSDYPNGPAPGEPPLSRIRLLEDRDQDGRFETSQVFVDRLLFATGLLPWDGGVLVTLGGELMYFRDEDGDGRADRRETWFRGFSQENPQLRANHPRLGPDRRIYIANGLRGGTIVANPEKWGRAWPEIVLGSMDFRFDPRTGEGEAVTGGAQFGLSFDDYGNRFICSNRNPARHVVLENAALQRNPLLAVRDVAFDVSPAGAESRVFPISAAWTTSTQHAGQFTAACGVTIYRGDALPAEYRGNSFTCEPTGNLIHRDRLEPHGVTFHAIPSDLQTEFLATADTWFRPVDLAHGPDGALYVVDMYRAVIEHPQWVPDELKARPDLYDGAECGRIYRITAKAPRKRSEANDLSRLTLAEQVELLSHPNAWRRETAQRLIWQGADPAAAALLREQQQAISPLGRIEALRTLQGLRELTEADLLAACRDEHSRVREIGIQATGMWLSRSPALRTRLIELVQDEDPRVRFQVALAIGNLPAEMRSWEALAEIAVRDAADPWTRIAVWTSAAPDVSPLLTEILRSLPRAGEVAPELLREAAELAGALRNQVTIAKVLEQLPAERRARFALVQGIGLGLSRRGVALSEAARDWPADLPASRNLAAVLAEAVQVAGDPEQPEPLRREAFPLLRLAPWTTVRDILADRAAREPSQALRLLALDVLASHTDPEVADVLLQEFAAQTPAVRRAILRGLLRDPARVPRLLTELSEGRIAVAELDAAQVRELTTARDPELRERALKILAAAIPADRKEVLAAYQSVLQLEADPLRGRAIFSKNCITCHKIGDLGIDVAPDIADSRTKTPAGLLTDILHPNQAIDNNYLSYTIVTNDGLSQTGIIAAESAASITLRQPEGKTVLVLRQEIDEIRSNGVSLMPEGLEKQIGPQEMADLISFIKNWRYLDPNPPPAPAPIP